MMVKNDKTARKQIPAIFRDGYQLNRRLIDYLEEVQYVFPDATIKNGMISAEVKC